jgi:hypothetical protein
VLFKKEIIFLLRGGIPNESKYMPFLRSKANRATQCFPGLLEGSVFIISDDG